MLELLVNGVKYEKNSANSCIRAVKIMRKKGARLNPMWGFRNQAWQHFLAFLNLFILASYSIVRPDSPCFISFLFSFYKPFNISKFVNSNKIPSVHRPITYPLIYLPLQSMNSKDIRLSKSLSWLLRHGAVREGLNISPEGYLDVDAVLQHRTFWGYSQCDIERVVCNNEKQRFQLREDPATRSLQIKANQGHSITDISDAELTPILTAKYPTVVHGTFVHCWPQIRQAGLSRMSRRHIHLATATDKSIISGLRRNAQIHVYINIAKALEDGIKFYESDNGVVLTPGDDNGFVKPKYFDKVVQVATGECYNISVKLKMEAGAAHPLAKVPSRPTFSKPPFARSPVPQHIPLTRPLYNVVPFVAGPGAVLPDHRPSHIIHRPVVQDHRQLAQVHRPVAQAHRPVSQDNRPMAQAHRPMAQDNRPMAQAHRQMGQGSRPAPRHAGPTQARDNWRRRRAEKATPTTETKEEKCYARMVQAVGFPGYTRPQDLIHAFSEFGPAKVDRMVGNTAALEFPEAEQAAAAVRASTTVCLYGEFLTVRPYSRALEHQRIMRNHRGEMEKSRPKAPTVDPKTISWAGDFHAQLDALLTAVRLSQDDIHRLAALYQDLEQVLQGAWPGCLPIPFGSVTTGLGVKASDADCFVLLPGATPAAAQQAVPKARRLLAQRPDVFASLVAIPNANTPIVKFYHLPTNTHCDLSFKTLLGVQNSKLIRFLLCADPRLLPLAVVIKYWAGVHELSGTGKLTNYALTMLIVFYLQQPGVAVLPPVAWLQRDRAHDFVVDGWNTGFIDDVARFPKTANAKTIAELIGGFFDLYSRFDFAELVVCPYLGRVIRKETFKDLNELPAEFERYKTNVTAGVVLPIRCTTPMCVQDPFEQCHNVASPVTTRLAAEIRAYFKFAADAFEKDKANGSRNFLKTILFEKPKLPRAKGKTEFRVNIHPGTMIAVPQSDCRAVLQDVVKIIFETILKIKLERVDKEDSDSERETAEADEAQNKQKKREKFKYTGVVTRAIWKRKQFTKLYSAMGLKFLEREKKITEDIMRTDKNVINVPFQLTVTYAHNPRSAVLVVRPTSTDLQFFKEFGKFFTSVMLHWFVILSRPHSGKTVEDKKQLQTVPPVDADSKRDVAKTSETVETENVNEVKIRESVETSDSDSVSDISYEDERVPPEAGAELTEDDTNQTPSDADKENIEEKTNTVGGKKTSEGDRDRSQRHADKTHNDMEKSKNGKAHDALIEPGVDKTPVYICDMDAADSQINTVESLKDRCNIKSGGEKMQSDENSGKSEDSSSAFANGTLS